MPLSVRSDHGPGYAAGKARPVLSAALVAICLGYFMVILDTTAVNVALPAVRTGLHTGISALQWVVDGYTLMFAALLLSGGALGDRLGARRVSQSGTALFVLASAGCAAAPTAATLVVARLVQGVGAALVVPASLALLRASYHRAAARARALGIWGGIAGVAAAAGPVVGGVLVTAASWRLVFLVNLPIGVAGMLLTARHIPAPPARPRALDPAAQVAAVLSLGGLTFGLIEGGRSGWGTPLVIAALTISVTGGVVFVLIERRVADPMLPLELFRSPPLCAGTLVGLLINLGFYGELFVINLYFQQVRGYSALIAGVALLPQMMMAFIASPLSGRATARAGGPRRPMLVGLLIGAAGFLGLVVAAQQTPYLLLVAPLAAAGFGMAFTMPAATTAVVDAAPSERSGLASGVISAARQVGGVVGVALLGDVASHASSPVLGLRIALVLSGAAFGIGAAIAFVVREQAGTVCPAHRRGARSGRNATSGNSRTRR